MANDAAFVDASYLLAVEMGRDANHQRSLSHWHSTLSTARRLITTTYVFDEVVTLLRSKVSATAAIRVGNLLLRSNRLELIDVDQALFLAGWFYFNRNLQDDFSLTDCISFVVMQRRRITTALSFDHHFSTAGFQLEPN